MNKFFLIVLILLLAAGCSPNNISESPENQTTADISQESSDNYYPVSLQALMQKQFDGRDLMIGEVKTSTANYTQHFISYKSGELTISGIMNIPKGEGPFPVVIMNHGYIDPAIYTNGRGLRREHDYFASRGYIVVHPDYRNHAQSDKDPDTETNIRLGYIEDVINAIYALKDANLPYADTNRIAMIGHSMGGGIAQAIMVVQPDLVKAYMLYAPVSSDARDSYNRWTVTRPEAVASIGEIHGSPDNNPEFWDNMSPRNFFDRVTADVMINHGTADRDVPVEWSETTHKLLQQAGKNSVLHTYPNEPHEFAAAWPTVMQRTLNFFNTHLNQ